ncbi:MAG: pirin family protein [Senegalia sp. (in: firmicutes)]|uniref:pirin family protein n=1 Tax=Senegalia sp. (in: firmicutes) TaxID=1924098 RepID=UPI003F96C6B2
MQRKVKNKVQGYQTQDGAGVKLVRVLGHDTIEEYDPMLMLDSFDSTNPDDYLAGFPEHPHRGIETISYLYRGKMTHKDSIGNEDTITDGEVQWMTAGSGILHSEMIPASERLLGVQLWLNLPKKDKMVKPNYHAIKKADIEEIDIEGGKIRLLAGDYKDYQGYQSEYLKLDYYDIHLEPGKSIVIDTDSDKSITLFTLLGKAKIANEEVNEKTAVKLTEGDSIEIQAIDEKAQVLFISSNALKEPVSWGGPIVMNTKEEINQAMYELRNGTFIREKVEY